MEWEKVSIHLQSIFFFGGDTPQLIAVMLHYWFTGGVFIFQFAEWTISTEEQTIFLLPVASRLFITWQFDETSAEKNEEDV